MKKILFIVLLFFVSIAPVFADDQELPDFPCDSADPDAPIVSCPIDTWVIAFAGLALTATVVHMRRKAKFAPME